MVAVRGGEPRENDLSAGRCGVIGDTLTMPLVIVAATWIGTISPDPAARMRPVVEGSRDQEPLLHGLFSVVLVRYTLNFSYICLLATLLFPRIPKMYSDPCTFIIVIQSFVPMCIPLCDGHLDLFLRSSMKPLICFQ